MVKETSLGSASSPDRGFRSGLESDPPGSSAMIGLGSKMRIAGARGCPVEIHVVSRPCITFSTSAPHSTSAETLYSNQFPRFYEVIEPFIKGYDNFRDDHLWFRHILRIGGVLEELADRSLRCHLVGIEEAPKPVLRVLREMLEKFNQSAPRLPGEGRRNFQLVITQKSAIQLATTILS